jgi:chitodextrinase
VTIPISNAADISTGVMYLRVDWPVPNSGVDDSVGTRMFDYVELLYKDQVIERHYGESMELLNDLQVPQAKQQVLQDLLGKGLTSNLASYYIRLPFSTNLPLCALSTHPLVHFKFKQIGEFSSAQWTGPVTMYLFVDYVYVTDPERDMFRSKEMDYMTHTFQRLEFQVGPNITTVPILTEFIDDVTELFWVVQTDGTSAYNYTNDGQDQLVSLNLNFDGIDVILPEVGTPLYLGSVQPLTYHTRSPDRKFYIYSFGLDPEDPQSTGQINFSKIIHQLHTLQLSPCVFSRQVRIYARTTRVLHLKNRELYLESRIAEAGKKIIEYNSGNNNHYPGLYYFDTFTFTTLSASGSRGPASTLRYANAPWSLNQFSIVDGQQYWTVPATGTYSITAAGAYGATPGRAVSGNLNLTQGQVLKMLVGQLPTPLTSNVVDNLTVGGGGGTFVTSGSTPLIVASGGDGTGGSAASFSPYGTGLGIDGAGYSSNGAVTSGTYLFLKPMAYIYGGFGNYYLGGVVEEEGGFGGGQSPKVSGISGGGGYTGSPGTGASGATCYGAGTITDLGAVSNTSGYVTVSLVNPAPLEQGVTLNPWVIQPTVLAPATTWSAVAYGNGVYVSVSNNGTYPVMYSTNGIEWSTDTSGSQTDSWISVTFGDGVFSAVSTSGSTAYSYDGINWVVKKSVLYTIVPGAGFDYFGTSIAMSSDGTVIAANIGPSDFNLPRLVKVYTNGVLSYTLTGNPLNTFDGFGTKSVALSANGTILAVGAIGDNYVKVYTNGVLSYTLTGNASEQFGRSVALSADGTILAVGAPDADYVKVYTNGVLSYTLTGDASDKFGGVVALSSDGTILAVGAPYGEYVKVYTNGIFSYQTFEFSSSNDYGKYLDLNSDGTILAVCTRNPNNYDRTIQIYNNGTILYSIVSASSQYPPDESVSLNSDGTILAVGIPGAYPVNGIVAVYTNGILANTLEAAPAIFFGSAVALSSDGNILSVSNGFEYLNLLVKIFNTFSLPPLSSVTYGNGKFVAVSNISSTFYSTNSINWSTGNALVDTWSSVTYGNGKFVAVSKYGTTSNVMYSLDGNIWSNVTTGTTSNSWTSVSYGNDRFLAISSTSNVMYSLNGIDWTTGVSTGLNSNCLTYGGGYFVCPSSNSSVSAVSISTNGQSWQNLSLTYTPRVYAGITYGDSGFVAVSSTGLLLGFVPTFWVNPVQVANSTKLNSVNWSDLAYGNGSFVAVGQGLIQTSLNYGNTWSSFAVSNTFTSVAYSSNLGKFVALPGFFGDGAYTSTDSSNWTLSRTLPSGVPSAPTSLTYGNGKFVAALYGDSNVFYSRDGLNWSLAQSQLAAQWSSITYGNGKFLAVSNSTSNFETMYSNDGITWTINSALRYTAIGGPSALSSDGTILAAAIDGSVVANVYTNGVLTYTVANTSSGPDYLRRVALSADGTILAVGSPFVDPNQSGNTKVYTNGVLSYTLVGNEYDNFGYAVALSADGTILAVGAPSALGTSFYVKVYTNGNLFYTLTGNNDYFGRSVALSANGTILAVGAPYGLTAGGVKVYTNGVLSYTLTGNDLDDRFGSSVALSANGAILAVGAPSANNDEGYVKVYTNGDLSYTLVGNNDNFGRSVDLNADGTILAVGAPNGNSDAGYVKVYTNQILTAVFSGTPPEALGNSLTLSSSGNILAIGYIDFSGPTPKTKIYDLNIYKKRGLSSVTYGNGLFVAVTNPGGSIYSLDGINWSDGNAPIDTWSAVSYGDGFFIAVSNNGTYPVMYSEDGIFWSTTVPGSQVNNWGSVAFGDGTFLAIPVSGATTMTTTLSKTFNNVSPSILPPQLASVVGFTASSPTTSTVNLAWNPVLYASQYSIVSSPPTITQTIPGTSFTFTGLTPLTAYTFTITPFNVSSNGSPTTSSSISTLLPPPPAVTGFTASSPTTTAVNLAWNSALYASQYSIVSSPPTTTQTTSGTNLTFTGLTPVTAYTFTITPSNASGNGPSTTSSSISTLLPPPQAVTGFTASSPTITAVNLAWNSALYASEYSIVSSPPTTTQTTSSTTFTFTGLSPDTAYTFTITPSNASGNGLPTSSSISTLPLPPPPPAVTGFTASSPTTTAVNLVWNSALNASEYSITSSPPTTTQTTSGTNLTFTGLTPATAYTFTITPSNVSGNGPSTTSASISTLSLPPVTTLAGLAGSLGSANGTGSAARFYRPRGVALDSGGNLYVADTFNNRIRKIVVSTAVVTLFAGSTQSGSNDGVVAAFNGPRGVACDTSGNVYVADTNNHTIRKIVVSTGVTTTLAGLAGSIGSTDGTGSAARFNFPNGVACDTSGNIYVAGDGTIRKIVASTGVVTTLAGLAGSNGSDDGTGSAARFIGPNGITCDTSGNIYVTNGFRGTIRKIVASTAVVTTIAGSAGSTGSTDGTGSAARFNLPVGITCDTAGNIFVADSDNYTIRKIVASTGVVTTIAGLAGSFGSANGSGSVARFNFPTGVACDTVGTIYVADSDNHTIRKIA